MNWITFKDVTLKKNRIGIETTNPKRVTSFKNDLLVYLTALFKSLKETSEENQSV